MIENIDKKRITWNFIRYRIQIVAFFRIKRFFFKKNDNENENKIVFDVNIFNVLIFKKILIIASFIDLNKIFFANLNVVFFIDTKKIFSNEIFSIINFANAIRMNFDKIFFVNLKIVFVDTKNVFSNEISFNEFFTIIIDNEKFIFYNMTREIIFDFKNIQFEIVRVNDIQITFDNNSKNTISNEKYLNCEKFFMINAKRMYQKNISSIFDIDQKFWKYWLINAIMKTKKNVNMFHQMIKIVFDTKKIIKLNLQIWINIVF